VVIDSIVRNAHIGRRYIMAVEKVGEKYRCNVCGNEVTVTKVGGGELVCCGEPMEKIAG
jgi:desulfoferrodoxin-like iron-binding protein